MARRPRSAQLPLALPSTWGGKRKGAGRKPTPGHRRATPHRARPIHKAAHPVHVTLRAAPGIPSLRKALPFAAIREAIAAASSSAFRVIQFSVQGDHVHLLVEAHDKIALSRGLRGLSIRAARALNRALGRRGKVWANRYHSRALMTPMEVRNALAYVLLNFRKHLPRAAHGLDPRSSAPWFDGFAPARTDAGSLPDEPCPVATARTWLATRGWRRHGPLRRTEQVGGH